MDFSIYFFFEPFPNELGWGKHIVENNRYLFTFLQITQTQLVRNFHEMKWQNIFYWTSAAKPLISSIKSWSVARSVSVSWIVGLIPDQEKNYTQLDSRFDTLTKKILDSIL